MTSTPSRNASLDALRVLSLLGIVILHVAGGGFADSKPLGFVLDELSRFAVPVFFVLSAYFWKPDELEHPFGLVARVARRVGVPFVCWVLLTIAWSAAFKPSQTLDLSPGGIALIAWTGGPAFHLWFLPALIVGTAITATAGRYLGWRATLFLAVMLFVIGTVLGSYAPVLLHRTFPAWIDRTGIFFAPVFLVAGVLLRRHRDRVAELPVSAIGLAVVIFAIGQLAEGLFVVPRYPMGHDYSLSTLGYGVSVAMLFMRLELRSSIWSALGRATFTAYLVHLLVMAILVDGLKLGANSLLLIALTFATALAIGLAWQWGLGAVRRGPASSGVGVERDHV